MPSTRDAQPERWTQATLKRRGWTVSLIRRFLDPPDALAPNPHYRSAGAPMKLYNAERVCALEATDTVAAALTQARQRSLRAKDRAAHQRQAMLDTVRSWTISVPSFTPNRLRILAVNHYNTLWALRGREDKWATIHDDSEFLDRIAVNYLRHVCTSYEDRLVELYGMIGATDARPLLKSRILSAIAVQYPELAHECRQQKNRLNDEGEE